MSEELSQKLTDLGNLDDEQINQILQVVTANKLNVPTPLSDEEFRQIMYEAAVKRLGDFGLNENGIEYLLTTVTDTDLPAIWFLATDDETLRMNLVLYAKGRFATPLSLIDEGYAAFMTKYGSVHHALTKANALKFLNMSDEDIKSSAQAISEGAVD